MEHVLLKLKRKLNNMQRIYSSASKIVLIVLVLTLCAGTIINPTMFLEPFKYAMTAVIGFYFGKSNGSPDDINISEQI